MGGFYPGITVGKSDNLDSIAKTMLG